MMEPIIWYLKANATMAILLGAYLIALRKETWFAARRAWLLAMAFLSLTLPLLSFPTGSAPALPFTLPAFTMSPELASTSVGFPWLKALVLLHALVSVMLIARLVMRFINALHRIQAGSHEAASFFNRIHLPSAINERDRAAVLAHEHAHARQGHSFDVLAFELLSALCWSNPLWRRAVHELRLVHEHLADAAAAPSSADYPELLIARAMRVSTSALHHGFNQSNLKTRLLMLQNKRSPKRAMPKLLWFAPALLLATALTSAEVLPPAGRPADAVAFAGGGRPAEFPGGMDALMRFLSATIVYPERAVKEGVEGTLHVSFTINASGKVSHATVKRGIREDLDKEGLRVVNAMPDWKPAVANGKSVDSEMTLPITFKLPVK
ncbi:MAG: TonB family protein [Flavobacteriales bacterium]|nr:TonB family protein [Flavobacteriales bacterium]